MDTRLSKSLQWKHMGSDWNYPFSPINRCHWHIHDFIEFNNQKDFVLCFPRVTVAGANFQRFCLQAKK